MVDDLYLHCNIDRRVSNQLDHSTSSYCEISFYQYHALGYDTNVPCRMQKFRITGSC